MIYIKEELDINDITKEDLDLALDYMYGTDRNKDNSVYTEKEKQDAVNYWIKHINRAFMYNKYDSKNNRSNSVRSFDECVDAIIEQMRFGVDKLGWHILPFDEIRGMAMDMTLTDDEVDTYSDIERYITPGSINW